MSFMLKKKGGKVFAPKVPVRRLGANSSAQSSTRPSVERQSQTPAPLTTPETIIIRDSETPDPATVPASASLESTPQSHILDTPQDARPVPSTLDTAAQKSVAETPDRNLSSDKESQKRKSRDDEIGVDESQKRHQPSSLDTPRTPPKSSPIPQISASEPLVQPVQAAARTKLSILQKTQPPSLPSPGQTSESPAEPAQASTPQSSLVLSNHSQPLNAIALSRADAAIIERSRINTIENSQPASADPVPEITESSSPTRYLPDSEANIPVADSKSPSAALSTSSAASDHAATIGVDGLGAAGDLGAAGVTGGRLAQTPIIAPLNPDGTSGAAVRQPATGTKKNVPKRRTIQDPEDGDNVRPTVEMQLNRPRPAPAKKPTRIRKERAKKDGKRAETPEDAEEKKIDPEVRTMRDMCKDLRQGKKFSKHDELRKREKDKIMKAKLAKHPELAGFHEDEVDGGNSGAGNGEAAPAPEGIAPQAEPEADNVSGNNPQMRIIDGNIVVDDSSLRIDRHAAARSKQQDTESITENDFTSIMTCGTHMKREKASLWDMAANETFYKGLKMFGTDFEMIAGLFPHRNRRQIKLKFCKEEKDNPRRIDKVLKGVGQAIELDTFEKLSGRKLESVEDIEAERAKFEAEKKAEEDIRLAEMAETERKKREEIQSKAAKLKASAKKHSDTVSDEEDDDRVDVDPADVVDENGWRDYRRQPVPRLQSRQQKNKKKRQQAATQETVVVLGDA